jgi:cytochrome b6-f complex iron-sulfur subunit
MSDEQTKATPPEQAGSVEAPQAETKPAPSAKRQLTPAEREKLKAEALAKAEAVKRARETAMAAESDDGQTAATTAAPAKRAAPAQKSAPAGRGTRGSQAKAEAEVPDDVTRREFLNLAWLGAMALLTVQTLGVSVLFLFPNFKEGEFGGIFRLQGTASEILPPVDGTPIPYNDGKFWLTNTQKGVYAIYKVCTHLGCLYAWQGVTHRFECPCHGSKYSLTGLYLSGPAPRSLDRFKIIATRPDGTIIETPADGAGIQLTGDETLEVDTGVRIKMPGKIEV